MALLDSGWQGGGAVDISLEWGGAKSKAKVHLRGDWKQVQEGGKRRGGDRSKD